jgi:hypothetical protein
MTAALIVELEATGLAALGQQCGGEDQQLVFFAGSEFHLGARLSEFVRCVIPCKLRALFIGAMEKSIASMPFSGALYTSKKLARCLRIPLRVGNLALKCSKNFSLLE